MNETKMVSDFMDWKMEKRKAPDRKQQQQKKTPENIDEKRQNTFASIAHSNYKSSHRRFSARIIDLWLQFVAAGFE